MFTTIEYSSSRLRGYLQAPETGAYYFWVSGDDESAFLISPTLDPNLAVAAASVPNGGFTGFRQWDLLPSQQSGPAVLQAGQRYYVEALEKNGHLNGHLSVGWTLPDGTFEGPIPAWRLNPVPGRLGNLPVVRIASPLSGSNYKEGDSVQVTAFVTSPDSVITQSSLLIDGVKITGLVGPSYQVTLPHLPAGNHTLTVQATDALSEVAQDKVTVFAFPATISGNLGLTDYEQATQTFTGPGSPLITDVKKITTIAGFDFSSLSAPGDWARSGTSLSSNAIQGWAQYQVNIPSPDVYRITIGATAFLKSSPATLFTLGVMIDGVLTDTITLPSGTVNLANNAVTYTPWLSAGQHTIRLIWQNYTMGNTIQIDGLTLEELNGPNTNGNGTKDWVKNRFRNLNSISIASESNQVSPACIEGTVNTFADMSISNGIIPKRGIASNWYANIPLQAARPTQITVNFENGAYQLRKSFNWTPTNLLPGGSVTIRAGDSLLLTAVDFANSAQVPVKIQVAGRPLINTTNQQPVPVKFDQAGTFKVTATYFAAYPQNSTSYNPAVGTPCTYTVTVVAADFGVNPIAWTDRPRVWNCPNIPASVVVQADPDIQFTKTMVPAEGRKPVQCPDDQPLRFLCRGPLIPGGAYYSKRSNQRFLAEIE